MNTLFLLRILVKSEIGSRLYVNLDFHMQYCENSNFKLKLRQKVDASDFFCEAE